MTFGISRGFAKVQILKALSLEPLVYFDKSLHTHYYWHDLDRGIAKSSPRDCKMTQGWVANSTPGIFQWNLPEYSGLENMPKVANMANMENMILVL